MAVFDWRKLFYQQKLMMVAEQLILMVDVVKSYWDAFLAFVRLMQIVLIGIAGKLELVCVSEFECMYSLYQVST